MRPIVSFSNWLAPQSSPSQKLLSMLPSKKNIETNNQRDLTAGYIRKIVLLFCAWSVGCQRCDFCFSRALCLSRFSSLPHRVLHPSSHLQYYTLSLLQVSQTIVRGTYLQRHFQKSIFCNFLPHERILSLEVLRFLDFAVEPKSEPEIPFFFHCSPGTL